MCQRHLCFGGWGVTIEELDLRHRLKSRLGLAPWWPLRSWELDKDLASHTFGVEMPTQFFQIGANSRVRKNYIDCLHTNISIIFSHEKKKVVMEYFTQHLGSSVPRPATFIVLRWPSLGYSPCSQKMKSEIPYSPCRGTRHQSRRFYWSLLQILLGTIKFDLTTCFSSLSLFTLNSQGVDVLNSANIILLQKNPWCRMDDWL